jgi:F-type H+-transporting ATPase subunit b
MTIDWFIVGAEIVNFLILVWLLKRYLYPAILNAMQEREARIASRLEEAEQREQEAQQKAEEYEQKEKELSSQRQEMLRKARQEAEDLRQELITESRDRVEEMERNWRQSVRHEQQEFLEALASRAGTEICALARQALADLAHEELEHEATAVFLRQLENLDEEQQETLREAWQGGEADIVVRTAFALEPQAQKSLTDLLRRELGEEARPAFARHDDLICGIELQIGGYGLSWSIDEYVDLLVDRVASLLEDELERAEETAREIAAGDDEARKHPSSAEAVAAETPEQDGPPAQAAAAEGRDDAE